MVQPHSPRLETDPVRNVALGRFGERLTRVDVRLADAYSAAKASPDDIHCALEAHVVGIGPVVVKDHVDNAHQAIGGAVNKLKRAATSEIEKHDPRSQRAWSAASIEEPDASAETGAV